MPKQNWRLLPLLSLSLPLALIHSWSSRQSLLQCYKENYESLGELLEQSIYVLELHTIFAPAVSLRSIEFCPRTCRRFRHMHEHMKYKNLYRSIFFISDTTPAFFSRDIIQRYGGFLMVSWKTRLYGEKIAIDLTEPYYIRYGVDRRLILIGKVTWIGCWNDTKRLRSKCTIKLFEFVDFCDENDSASMEGS